MKSLLNPETRRELKLKLLAAFEANRHDLAFQRLVNIYIRQALPLILKKLTHEVDQDKLKKKALNGWDWFQFWLTTMTDKQLNLSFPVLYNPFHHFDNEKLAEYPFHMTVRNIPVFMWDNLNTFPTSLVLHLASGKSIRTYKEIVPMSRKMAHIFQNLKYGECAANEYYLYCVVKLMGGSNAFFKMVFPFVNLSGSLESNRNILKRYDPALKKLLEWDTVNALNATEQRRLMGFIDHKLYEMNNFSFKGRTLKATLQLSREYYIRQALRQQQIRQKLRDNSLIRWTASNHQGWNYWYKKGWYAIFELTNAYDLEEESAQMNHCVRDYANDCASGECSIWSLKRKLHDTNEWISLVTIEMDKDSQLVQLKARFNQQPKEEYMKMINDWRMQEGLGLFLYEY